MATVTFSIGTAVGSAGTGNVDTDGTTAVTSGSGSTLFTSELTRPGTIEIAGTLYDIASITDDDNLVTEQTVGSGTNQSYNIGVRHYSTITLWEADLDDTVPYNASDDAVGECYADSDFDEAVTVDGGDTIGLASVELTVASAERHDGTAGTGAVLVMSAAKRVIISPPAGAGPTTFRWLELDLNDKVYGNNVSPLKFLNNGSFNEDIRAHTFLFHNATCTGGSLRCVEVTQAQVDVTNSIIYACSSTGAGGGTRNCHGIDDGGGNHRVRLVNLTLYKIEALGSAATNNALGVESGVSGAKGANSLYQNLIVMDTLSTNGLDEDFAANISTGTEDHNISSDDTAAGTGSLTEKSSADQFVSTTGGSEDLHLKTGADAIGAGADLGTTPAGVQFDIDNFDRDTEAVTWDMGADQFIASGLLPAAIIMLLNRDKINPIRQM